MNNGLREDCVLLTGAEDVLFAKVHGVFEFRFREELLEILVVRIFREKGRHELSGFLEVEDVNDMDIVLAESIIRPAHILPPMVGRNAGIPRRGLAVDRVYTIADVVDADMYLRLKHLP